MKTAIISVTKKAALLGQRIKAEVIPDADCYEKDGKISGKKAYLFSTMKPLMEDLFLNYDRILCIMATGIVVRMIAPFIKHKSLDPAIVVMDEAGHYAISLLSGHLGGANEWASEIALGVNAEPIITTATDVNGYPAPDVIARKLHFRVDDFSVLKRVNAAIVEKQSVPYYIDNSLVLAGEYSSFIQEFTRKILGESQLEIPVTSVSIVNGTSKEINKEEGPCVIVTDQLLNLPHNISTHALVLRPPTMTIGIGCRRNTSKILIMEAIQNSLKNIGRSYKSVMSAASVIVKADEEGLLEAVNELHWPITFFTQEEIASIVENSNISTSDFVKKTIGVGNVCETTALLMAQSQTLIQKKTIYPKTTVAIAQVELKLSALDQVMKNL